MTMIEIHPDASHIRPIGLVNESVRVIENSLYLYDKFISRRPLSSIYHPVNIKDSSYKL